MANASESCSRCSCDGCSWLASICNRTGCDREDSTTEPKVLLLLPTETNAIAQPRSDTVVEWNPSSSNGPPDSASKSASKFTRSRLSRLFDLIAQRTSHQFYWKRVLRRSNSSGGWKSLYFDRFFGGGSSSVAIRSMTSMDKGPWKLTFLIRKAQHVASNQNSSLH
ncbi:hypothetical protein NE237_033280 [Protea cynaroides]|uniref:Uncharacterized protein n=1 Tax=Protea cynaroides TaxID=273540 RepID=A0A9Q0L4K6_9MAGN|nr:hypothetical protein NE237_033280 [Protea cynaroides]